MPGVSSTCIAVAGVNLGELHVERGQHFVDDAADPCS
jgi:hypothetical protein